MIAARAEPKLSRRWKPLVRRARQTLNEIWTNRLTIAGHEPDEVRRFIEMSHFLMRGFVIAETWLPYETDREDVLRAWRSVAPVVLKGKSGR